MAGEKENSIEDLLLGNVGEEVGESDEQFAVRLAAAQAKLAQIKKDEGSSRDFDGKLAKIIQKLHDHTLKLVVFLIDHEVPSLTILAMISLASDEAGKICYQEFHKYIEETADFSLLKLDEKIEEKLSLWWTFIFASDQVSRTVKLDHLRNDDTFTEVVSLEFTEMVHQFLERNNVEHFDQVQLEKLLKKYEKMIFQGNQQ